MVNKRTAVLSTEDMLPAVAQVCSVSAGGMILADFWCMSVAILSTDDELSPVAGVSSPFNN